MNLTARDIVMIMNRAAKLGVTSLTIGELDISFSPKNRSAPQEASISRKPTVAVSPVDEKEQKAVQAAADKAEQFRAEQEQFLNAPVLSPYEWEQQQANILQAGGEDDDRGEIEDAEGIQV